MFGKDQPEVVTEEDVGNYVDELKKQANREINAILDSKEEDDNELAGGSEATTTGTQGKK